MWSAMAKGKFSAKDILAMKDKIPTKEILAAKDAAMNKLIEKSTSAYCYFCNYGISVLDGDYKVDEKRLPERICFSCDNKRRVIRQAAKEGYEDAMIFFSEQLQRDEISWIAKEIINDWIEEGERNKAKREEKEKEKETVAEKMRNFRLTTGYNFEGQRIVEYKGLVSGVSVLGTGLISDLSAVLSDTFGTESNALENKILDARESAKKKMIQKAYDLGGNGIIGIDFDMNVLAMNTIAILATGTVVLAEEDGHVDE